MKTNLVLSCLLTSSTILNLLTQILLGKKFGVGLEMDSYITALSFPLTVSALICAPLAYLLVPELSIYRSTLQVKGVATFLVLSLLPYLLLLSSFGFLIQNSLLGGYFAHDALVSVLGWVLVPINVISLIFTSAAQVQGRFLYIGFSVVLPSLVSFLFCSSLSDRIGIQSAIIGQLSGSVIVVLHLIKSQSAQQIIVKAIRNKIIFSLPTGFLATLIFSVYPMSDAYWGKIVGVSTISHLAYAQKIIVGLSGVVVAGSNVIAFQRIAGFASQGRDSEMRNYLANKISVVIEILLPISILGAATAKTVGLLAIKRLETGVIQANDVLAIAEIIQPMLIGMVFMSTMGFVFKSMIADNKGNQAAWISLLGSLFYFASSGILQWFLGPIGIGCAYMVTWLLVFLVSILYFLKWQFIKSNICNSKSLLFASLMRNIIGALLACVVLNCIVNFKIKNEISAVGTIALQGISVFLIFGFVRYVPVTNIFAFFAMALRKPQ